MLLSARAAAALAAASLLAFAPACSSVLGDYSYGPEQEGGTADGSIAEAGGDSTQPPAEGGGDTGGGSSSGGDSGGGHDGATPDSGVHDSGPTDSGSAGDGNDGGCSATQQLCNGSCVPLDDPAHCGSCTLDCQTLPNTTGTATCAAGVCGVTCASSYANCAGTPNDGCPDSLTTTTNCGGCGVGCTSSAPVCGSSGMTYSCVTGCSGATPDYCPSTQQCVSFQTDPNNCNGCANVCSSVPNGTPTCTGGACGIACPTNDTNCGSTVGCVDLTSNPGYCGSCTTACAAPANATATCSNSTCGFTCNANYTQCASGCYDLGNDPSHCGSCTTACGAPANATATCSNSTCGYSCNAGTPTFCSASNTCVDTTSDGNNCGSCGHSCLGGACTSSVCQPHAVAPNAYAMGVATDDTSVYYSDGPGGHLVSVPIRGGTPTTLVTASGGTTPFMSTVYYDANSRWVFTIDGNNAVVYGVDPATATIMFRTAALGGTPRGLWANLANVYWGLGNHIDTAPKSSASSVTTNNTLPSAFATWALTFDTANNQFLVGSIDSTGLAGVCPLTAGGTCVTNTDQPGVTGVAVAAGKAFAVNRGTNPYTNGGLSSATLNASSLSSWTPLALGSSYASLNASMGTDGTNVYWIGDSNYVYSCSAASGCGANPTVVAPSGGSGSAITADALAIVWATQGGVFVLAK